jgi:hypothetical protein
VLQKRRRRKEGRKEGRKETYMKEGAVVVVIRTDVKVSE